MNTINKVLSLALLSSLGLASSAHAAPVYSTPTETIRFYSTPTQAGEPVTGRTGSTLCTPGDVCGTTLQYSTTLGGRLTTSAVSRDGVAAVEQDLTPAYGGLGVVGRAADSLDNIGRQEKLTLKFDKLVEIRNVTFFNSKHLKDFYESPTQQDAQFRLTVVNNGVSTSAIYDLEHMFQLSKPIVGQSFTFGGLYNDVVVNGVRRQMSFYVGGLDIGAFKPPVDPIDPVVPPKGVPEPGSIALFGLALLGMFAVKRRGTA